MDFKKVQNIIAETLGCDVEEVTLTASLADDLGADSLAAVELVMALEEGTGVTIAERLSPPLRPGHRRRDAQPGALGTAQSCAAIWTWGPRAVSLPPGSRHPGV